MPAGSVGSKSVLQALGESDPAIHCTSNARLLFLDAILGTNLSIITAGRRAIFLHVAHLAGRVVGQHTLCPPPPTRDIGHIEPAGTAQGLPFNRVQEVRALPRAVSAALQKTNFICFALLLPLENVRSEPAFPVGH